jgi:hypothetical protein
MFFDFSGVFFIGLADKGLGQNLVPARHGPTLAAGCG